MKFSRREQFLVVGLGLVVLIIAYYFFIFNPQLQNIRALRKQAANNDSLIKGINDFLDPNGKLPREYKIMKAKTDEQTRMFFPLADQEKTILALDQMLASNLVNGLSISFGDVKLMKSITKDKPLEQLSYYLKSLVEDQGKGHTKTKTAPASAANDKNQIPGMELTIHYSGTYDRLLSFLSTVESWEKKMFVKSIIITPSKDALTVSGNIIFDLFMLPKYPDSDLDFLNWDITGTYGSANPFVFIGGAPPTVPDITKESTVAPVTDFVMSMKPITADLPAVVLGKSKDYTKASYVYSDSTGFANTRIKVTKKDGTYYFQYQTQNESYPKDNSLEAFQPLGNTVSLLIYSTPRNPEDDQNGINLSISNETDLPFIVQILNDDPAKPRVKVTERNGDVQIK